MLLHAEIYNTLLIPELKFKIAAWNLGPGSEDGVETSVITVRAHTAERTEDAAVHDECSQSADAQHRELKQWRDPAAARGHECA